MVIASQMKLQCHRSHRHCHCQCCNDQVNSLNRANNVLRICRQQQHCKSITVALKGRTRAFFTTILLCLGAIPPRGPSQDCTRTIQVTLKHHQQQQRWWQGQRQRQKQPRPQQPLRNLLDQ